MTKRSMIRIVSLSIAAVIITAGAALAGWQRANLYKRSLENTYQRAFSELVSSMSGIDYALQKTCISSTPGMLASLGSEVFRQSASATTALSQLPFSDMRLEKTSKFISQVGDWSYALSKRAASGEQITAEERQILQKLASTADALSIDLNNLIIEINEQGLEFGEVVDAENRMGEEGADSLSGVAQNIAYLEQEFPEYPTLVYDGPFSEHIDQRQAAYLEGKAEVTEEAARATAAKFLGVDAKTLQSAGKSGGKLPVYTFTGSRAGGEISIDVTCKGGVVLEMMDSRTPGEPTLNLEQATAKAKEFLAANGYTQMKESYWTVYSDTVMINFSPVQDGAVLYPDLVKVGVALDNGAICNFEAQGFVMNHKQRTIPEAKITLEQAKQLVAGDLEIKGHNLAIVPSNGQNEEFVHEMQCERADGTHCLVYLDAQTGEEVQIFILIEDENGILAM